jgi:MHS family proline/betaine transporter-like MFS transporter
LTPTEASLHSKRCLSDNGKLATGNRHLKPGTRIILAASAGNALEFFDFTLFGYFVPQISDAFFPAHTHTGSLLYTWGTYATAFLARPLGAMALGSYADRAGRRAAMSLAIILMTIGTAMVAAMPRYGTIGLLAPLGILLARLVQGFSTGGEFGGATAFMLEHGRGRRGFMASFQFTSQVVSTIAASGVGWLTSVLMPEHALHDWGFRIPFALGLLIGPAGLYLRRHTEETPVFQQAGHTSRPARTVMLHYPVRVVLAACTISAGTAATYIGIYLPTYAQTELHMQASYSFLLPMLGSAISLVVTPTVASWSDRIGRLVPSIIGAALLLVLAYPCFLVIATRPGFVTVALAAAAIAALRSSYTAPLPALFGELFPPAVRGVGMSVSYSLGVVLFGSITPLANTWAIHATGLKSFPGLWLAAMSVISLASLLVIGRTYRLEDDS